jgi:hypothetical protein
MDATRRARERALQSLKQLQADAEAAPPPPPAAESADLHSPPLSFQTTSPQIGFVPPTPISTPSQSMPQDSVMSPAPVRIGFVPQSANDGRGPQSGPRPLALNPLESCSQAPSCFSASPRLCVEMR